MLLKVAGAFCAEIELAASSPKDSAPRWLTLAGKSGIGKTHLAKEVHAWVRKYHQYYRHEVLKIWQCRSVCFVEAADLASDWKSGVYGRGQDLESVFLLIIDDLGAERDTSGFLGEQWSRLLNRRLGKWTMLTSNLSLSNVSAKTDARVASRLRRADNVVLQSAATDYSLSDEFND